MSDRYKLTRTDSKKILIGAGIAVLGALLTYGSEVVAQVDFGDYTPFVVAIWSILVNTVKKYLEKA